MNSLPKPCLQMLISVMLHWSQTAEVMLLTGIQKTRNAPLLDRQKAEQDRPWRRENWLGVTINPQFLPCMQSRFWESLITAVGTAAHFSSLIVHHTQAHEAEGIDFPDPKGITLVPSGKGWEQTQGLSCPSSHLHFISHSVCPRYEAARVFITISDNKIHRQIGQEISFHSDSSSLPASEKDIFYLVFIQCWNRSKQHFPLLETANVQALKSFQGTSLERRPWADISERVTPNPELSAGERKAESPHHQPYILWLFQLDRCSRMRSNTPKELLSFPFNCCL